MTASALILAAGAGTRMKSEKPKVAHELLGKPLLRWVVDTCKQAGIDDTVCVLGHQREQVIPLVEDHAKIVFQENRLGTGDAVFAAHKHFAGKQGSVLVLSGDAPLIKPETVTALTKLQQEEDAAMVVLTMDLPDPFGYGRIERDESGCVLRIVEQKDCSEAQAALTECNSGTYCFDIEKLFWALSQVGNNNAQGEYYLTDVLEILRQAGHKILAYVTQDNNECKGINSRAQLAEASKIMQRRINKTHLEAGVTMLDPDQVWIGPEVSIEPDVEILPQTYIWGQSHIGSGCLIGPNTRLTDVQIGKDCVLDETVACQVTLEEKVSCGPRSYLRPGTYMEAGSKAGTHVEIKKSRIGAGSKVPHLSYIGDATLGTNVNIGAGSITCNYDGTHKHATYIGNDVFVGSDTMLVAPVNLGDECVIGAGSVITQDVEARALGLGRARQHNIEGWALRQKK